MRGWLALLGTVLLVACSSGAATSPGTTPSASPAAVTASAVPACPPTDSPSVPEGGTVPAAVSSNLQAILDRRIADRPEEPSVSAAVIGPGGVMWAGAGGVEDTTTKRPATPETAYAVGSITKTFTAALAMLLVRDGKLALDKPAAGWLDGTAATKSNGATIRQLLAHRSGIASYTDNDAILAPGKSWTAGELLDLVGPAHFAPGQQYEYSNSNYLLLGLIIEKAGGEPLEKQLRDRLLEPLGLKRTFASAREPVAPPLAHGYGSATQLTGDLYDGSGRVPNRALATGAWAAGDIASTPGDIAHWLYALCNGTVLGDQLTSAMFDLGGGEYGLGIQAGTFPGVSLAVGHVGAIPGYVALAFYMADSRNVIVVGTNADVDDLYLVLLDLDTAAKRG